MSCSNINGKIMCSNNVVNMYSAYWLCYKLTASPVCGNKVINMCSTYKDCRNLSSPYICGANVTDMSWTYGSASGPGNAYIYSNNVTNVDRCFNGKFNLSGYLNIFVHKNIITYNTFYKSRDYQSTSFVGGLTNIDWYYGYSSSYGSYKYDSHYNIALYTVDNVAQARAKNGD